jgi:hypothetical protein
MNPSQPLSLSSSLLFRNQQNNDTAFGQRLLTLLRRRQPGDASSTHNNDQHHNTSEEENDNDAFHEIAALFQNILAIVQRRGMLQGNVGFAEQILKNSEHVSSSQTTMGTTQQQHKKNKKRSRFSDAIPALTMGDSSSPAAAAPPTTAALDVQLLLSALSRVFEQKEPSDVAFVAISADIVTAECEYLLNHSYHPTTDSASDVDVVYQAEYELLSGVAKHFLTGLENHIRRLVIKYNNLMTNQKMYNNDREEPEKIRVVVLACLRAAAALVNLLGIQLSRSNALMQNLWTTAWEAAVCVEEDAATRLLAVLPLVGGGTQNASPALLWSQTVTETLSALQFWIQQVLPSKNTRNSDNATEIFLRKETRQLLDCYLSKIRDESCSKSKATLFLKFERVLVSLLRSLLSRDAIGVGASTETTALHREQLLGCEINASVLLEIIEDLMNFAETAENHFFATKKRLRHETAADGRLLSVSCVAEFVANPMRQFGHDLLNTTLSALGASALLPYARRIHRMTYSSLRKSASSNLQKVLDPARSLQDGKKKRWLHTSVSLRTSAVVSFHQTVLTFGVDPQRELSLSTSSKQTSNSIAQAILYICGFITEEFILQNNPSSEEWGTFFERIELVAASLDCLTACLTSNGEFLPISTRALIDSVCRSCLRMLSAQNRSAALFGSVESNILQLGIAAVSTSWPDGAACDTIAKELKTASRAVLDGPDKSEVLTAKFSLKICAALECPRLPALGIVKRSDGFLSPDKNSITVHTAESIAEQLQQFQHQDEELTRVNTEAVKHDDKDDPQELVTRKISKKSKDSTIDEKRMKNPMTVTDQHEPASIENPSSIENVTNFSSFAKVASLDELATNSCISKDSAEKKPFMDDLEDSKPPAKVYPQPPFECNDHEEEESEFPMIVDCGPDEEDM